MRGVTNTFLLLTSIVTYLVAKDTRVQIPHKSLSFTRYGFLNSFLPCVNTCISFGVSMSMLEQMPSEQPIQSAAHSAFFYAIQSLMLPGIYY